MNSSTKTVSTLSNKLIQMMNDDEIMKRKLMIDGDGCGDDRKISNLIKQFLLWCYNDNETELECQLSAERLLNAIDQSELAMAKSVETIKMITNELDNYENIYKNIEKSINDAKSKLQSCKAELAYAKQIRRYKLEYDSISNIIEKHPSTQETQIKLNALDEQIQNLQKINNQIESKLEKRRRQFQLLLSTSHQLQSVLDDENESNDLLNTNTIAIDQQREPQSLIESLETSSKTSSSTTTTLEALADDNSQHHQDAAVPMETN
ncbi:pre-mRNA-splicing factor SPF27 [Sarcoptes scabiei]|nr:pre-mRNA-splicing factor SPF27 [Sarcoptes scabiei]